MQRTTPHPPHLDGRASEEEGEEGEDGGELQGKESRSKTKADPMTCSCYERVTMSDHNPDGEEENEEQQCPQKEKEEEEEQAIKGVVEDTKSWSKHSSRDTIGRHDSGLPLLHSLNEETPLPPQKAEQRLYKDFNAYQEELLKVSCDDMDGAPFGSAVSLLFLFLILYYILS